MDSKPTTGQSLIGSQLGKYRIVEEVGMGGMSIVYRAIDEVLDREVAVKLLHSHLSRRREARIRFHREARAVAKLKHPNIVEIYDFSTEDSERAYIVTEFVRGPTLREFIETRGVKVPEIGAMIVIQVADALSHAHSLGVIHRDVKPENVMIRADGVVKLMDFGIAHIQDAQRMTQTGSLLGSPAHMAPESIAGEESDERSDIFSLGTVLYFATTGNLPFTGRNPAAVLRAISDGNYPDPQMCDPRIGQKLAGIIRTSLARTPGDRYQTAREMAEDLREAVAEVGLAQVTSELGRYFAQPDAYESNLLTQTIEALERRGREAFNRREVGRAVDCMNRILAIDDSHEAAHAMLARLDRRRQYTGYALAALAFVAAILLGLTVTGTFRPGSTATRGDPDMASLIENAMAGVGDSIESASYRSEAGESARDRPSRSSIVSLAQGADAGTGSGTTAGEGEPLPLDLVAVDDPLQEELQRTLVERPEIDPVREMSAPPEPTGNSATRPANGQEGPEAVESRADGTRSSDADRSSVREPPVEPTGEPDAGNGGGDSGEAVALAEPDGVLVYLWPPFPPTVALAIDGGEYQLWNAYSAGLLLSPGTHTLSYRDPLDAVVPQSFEIDVPAGETEFRVRERHICPWRDALFIVRSDLMASIIVDGRPAGRSGETLRIPITAPQGRQEFEVVVIPDGEFGAPVERTVELSAARTQELEVTLRPE